MDRLTDEQIDALEKSCLTWVPGIIRQSIIQAFSDLRHYKQALEFYADEATYDIEHLGRHGYIIIDKDGGKIAREALGKENHNGQATGDKEPIGEG